MSTELYEKLKNLNQQIKILEHEIIDDIGKDNFNIVSKHIKDKYYLIKFMSSIKNETFVRGSKVTSLGLYNDSWLNLTHDYLIDEMLLLIDNRLEAMHKELIELLGQSYDKMMYEVPRLVAETVSIKFKLNGVYGMNR